MKDLTESTQLPYGAFMSTADALHATNGTLDFERYEQTQHLHHLKQQTSGLRHIYQNDVVNLCLTDNLEDIANQLKSMGFRRLNLIGSGSSALVFEVGGNQVIRLMVEGAVEKERVQHPTVLQNIAESTQSIPNNENRIIYEIQPKLSHYVNHTNKAYQRIASEFLKVGIRLDTDLVEPEQFGILKDGTPVILERDVSYQIYHPLKPGGKYNTPPDLLLSPPPCPNFSEWLIESDLDSTITGVPKGFISKQEHFFPALRDHRVRDVLSDADIERLRQGELEDMREEKPECFEGITEDNLSEFIELVQNDGCYPSQAQQIMKEKGIISDQPKVRVRDVQEAIASAKSTYLG